MGFVSPIWLFALVPWLLVTVWLLTGQHERTAVPFLELWRGTDQTTRTRAKLRRPPLALLGLILSMLFALLAAARPRVYVIPYTIGPKITIIVDCGITMSARGQSQPRYLELAQFARMPIMHWFGFGPTELILVPDGRPIECDRLDFYVLTSQTIPPPVDTREMLPPVIERALKGSDGPVVVLTDQEIRLNDPRLIVIPPQTTPRNIGIVTVAARNAPSPQLMLRLRNDSTFSAPILRLNVDGVETLRTTELPPTGSEKDLFFDLPRPARRFEVELNIDDDIKADNKAVLTFAQTWPRVVVLGNVPDEVQRMIQTYTKLRPPIDESWSVNVSDRPPEATGAVVVAGDREVALDDLTVAEHAINVSVDWRRSLREASVAPAPGEGWRAIVSAGQQVLVAVRDSPSRQAWIGFTSESFPRTSDFVIFWTNVLDWLGSGENERWDVQLIAAIPIHPSRQTDWLVKLSQLPTSMRRGLDLAPGLLLLAVSLVFLAMLAWGRASRA
jgi:hypothetical protein